MSIPVPKIGHLWPTPGSDFVKTNHQNHIKMLIKLPNIFIKLCTMFGVLSFNIKSVFRLFAKGKTFVYMSPCSQKFETLTHPASTSVALKNTLYIMPGRKRMVQGNHLTQKTIDL